MRFLRVPFAFLLLVFLALAANGQSIVSATAGVLQFFEGSVTIDDHSVEHKAASFPAIRDGSILHTQRGRAEVLLSPGFYLRLDENSAVRMISNSLADTRLEVLSGSVIADSLDAKNGNHVELTFKDAKMRFPAAGVYRIDVDTGVLQAYSGKAEIVSAGGKSTNLDEAHLYFLEVGVETDKITGGTEDEFYDWARDRNEALSAQNQLAAQNNGESDDADADPGLGGLGGLGAGSLPPVPYVNPPNYSYQPPYGSGSYWTGLMDPYLGYGYTPFGFYNSIPLVLVLRPPTGRYPWPHRPLPGMYTSYGTAAGFNGSGIIRPYQPRPLITAPARGTSGAGYGVSHSSTITAPRTTAISPAHIGHR